MEIASTVAEMRSLRDANTLSPNHPLVLSELASTYTQMGLDEKAAEFWRSVYVLGPERAGAFYDLADMALKGNRIEEAPPIDSVLSVGEVQVLRSPNTSDGERLTLRIPIRSRPHFRPSRTYRRQPSPYSGRMLTAPGRSYSNSYMRL